MERYLLIGWPESQPYQSRKDCVPTCDDYAGAMFVPESVYLKRRKDAPEMLIEDFKQTKERLLAFIAKNVPEKGIHLTKKERDSQECRITWCDHFSGEYSRLNVTDIYPGRVEGVDDYGNRIERCSLSCDVDTDAIYDIARFLYYYRGKRRV